MIKIQESGLMGTNSTFVSIDENHTVIIDAPEGLVPSISAFLSETGTELCAVILTHGHFDHIAGLGEIEKEFGNVKVFLSKEDEAFLSSLNEEILSAPGFDQYKKYYMPLLSAFSQKTGRIEGNLFSLEVIRTPGHTPGSISLFSKDENILFSGDTLFIGGKGRTDFPLGSFIDEENSIDLILSTFSDDTRIVPGHGISGTIREAKYYL